MSLLVTPNTNQVVFIGEQPNHPLAANLGEMILCGDCGVICFTAQTSEVAKAFDLKSKKRICLACQTKDAKSFQVEIIH